jgi:uncharacterized protein (DUF1697 family)
VPNFVVFLRAVNVGKRKYPMAELRAALTTAGFEDVQTHIQTGNALVRTSMRSRAKVAAALEKAMRGDRGFAVPVVVMTPQELSEVYEEACDFGGGKKLQGHYLTLLADPPTEQGAKLLEARSEPGAEVRVGKRAVHLMLDKPYNEVTTSNAEVERHLGVATTRNLTVITKLAEKWGT